MRCAAMAKRLNEMSKSGMGKAKCFQDRSHSLGGRANGESWLEQIWLCEAKNSKNKKIANADLQKACDG